MQKKNMSMLLVVCISVFSVYQLGASNLSFLKYALITDFTEKDIQQLSQEYKQVLDKNKPGDVHKWQSAETKVGGEITVIKQYRQNANLCKRLMFKSYSAKQSATSYFNFCMLERQWTLVN